ncbi:histidine kinase [Myxococcus sp. K15C18031901]|uniref:sensor histidine kinase n=1 Tax=Myxococcus dinghuensis TaxID=2906761 RepID=UPI0020A732CF|nr:histidine kinase [Myxococcus dinghuensis]MCP3103686.1 histidine kinase [Myxococcus dinghuensis]
MAAAVVAALPQAVERYAREPHDFSRKLALALIPYSLWGLLGPVLLATFRRLTPAGPPRVRGLAPLLGAGGAFVLVHGVLLAGVVSWLEPRPWATRPFVEVFRELLLTRSALGLFEYLLLLAGWLGFHALEHRRALEVAEARWSVQLAEARLQALRAQLDPHFLFNTLNAVVALVRQSRNPEAVTALVELGELLRASLEGRGDHQVLLSAELELVRRYLGIERLRFGDSLDARLEPAPGTLEARVPALILQPLVENAIKHGTSRRATRGQVLVRARRQGERLVLEVWDDGPGPKAVGTREGTGIGVKNTRARLQQLYGEGAGLSLEEAPGGGTLARVELPFMERGAVMTAQEVGVRG